MRRDRRVQQKMLRSQRVGGRPMKSVGRVTGQHSMGNMGNGVQTNLRTRQGQFINRRTGQSVSPNMPYHTHEGQAMAGAMHVDTPHDKYDRSMNNSGNQNNMRRTRRRRLGRDNY